MFSRGRGRRRTASIALTFAVVGAGVVATPAMAQEGPAPGAHTCRGTAVKTGNLFVLPPEGIRLGNANPQGTPCVGDYDRVVGLSVPVTNKPLNPLRTLLGVTTGLLLYTGVAEGLTADEPNNNGAGSTARVAYVRLNVLGLLIEVGAVESHARARVDGCSPSSFGYSDVASLRINNRVVAAGNQPVTIPLGIGTIYLNQQTRAGNTLTQRAVHIDLPGTALDVTLGESVAGAEPNCVTAPIPTDGEQLP